MIIYTYKIIKDINMKYSNENLNDAYDRVDEAFDRVDSSLERVDYLIKGMYALVILMGIVPFLMN